jgi:hypothetical protein
MLVIGAKSKMLAATMLLVITVLGVGISELGAAPCVHCITAFMQT